MAVSLKNVAAMAGVSPITVSRVLNNSRLVTDGTRAKVLEACRCCGYQPHAAARALRSSRFDTIGLLLPTEERHARLPYALLAGITDELESRKQSLQVIRLTDMALTSCGFAPRILSERMVDGLLINYEVDLPPGLVQKIHEHQLPSIWINIKASADSVYPDMFGGAQKAIRRLLELGHRHIGYLDFTSDVSRPDQGHYSVRDCYEGCRHAVEASHSGARLEIMSKGGIPRRDRPGIAGTMLGRHDRPTAIITFSSRQALTCLHAALSLGLRVPDDLSMVTYHDEPVCDETGLAFGTISVPESEMGRIAVRMLMEKIREPEPALPSVCLDMPFRAGETCAPAPKTQA